MGAGAITYKIIAGVYRQFKFWDWLPQTLKNSNNFKPTEWKHKYGDSYVLVTGAADGIGYAYAR